MAPVRLTIDRIEDGVAVCSDEDGNIRDYPLYYFPEGAAEGSVIDCVFEGNELLSARLQTSEEHLRKAENEARLRTLFSKRK